MSSGWFDCTEPSLSTYIIAGETRCVQGGSTVRSLLYLSLQGKQGVQGADALVQGSSSTSNLIEPTRTPTPQRYSNVWSGLSHKIR